MSALSPQANHPGLIVSGYADAVRARAAGDGERAWMLEDAAFNAPHFTPIDYACRGLARLRHGFWDGWLSYEWRWADPRHRVHHARPFMITHEPWHRFGWDSSTGQWVERQGWEEELQKLTILVGPEGGAGDMIMLSRFLPWLAERAKHVYWLVPTDLRRLAIYGYGSIIDVISQEDLPPFDRYVMMFSLPAIVGHLVPGMRYDRTYQPERWNRAHPAELVRYQSAMGLAWTGSPLYARNLPMYGNTDIRSMGRSSFMDLLGALCALPKPVPLISYQRGESADWGDLHGHTAFNAKRAAGDWFDTYVSLARECKLVITVDTGLAHLAGAMGIPTCCLLAYDHCWRHGPETLSHHSHWYPSMRLVKQQRPGDWSYPIAEVVRQLRAEHQ